MHTLLTQTSAIYMYNLLYFCKRSFCTNTTCTASGVCNCTAALCVLSIVHLGWRHKDGDTRRVVVFILYLKKESFVCLVIGNTTQPNMHYAVRCI